MADDTSSSDTTVPADQVTDFQHPVVSATALPLPPPGQPPVGTSQFTYQVASSAAQLPPVVSHAALVDSRPVVSQLHAYTALPSPVFSRPRPTATTQDQFRYEMPQMPDFTAAPVAPPPRAPTSFPASVLVTPPLPPRDPLQANMVETQLDLVDHFACLMEVVHRQIYWQMRQTESLIDTHQHLLFLWENSILSDSVQPLGDVSPLWSPVQYLPEGLESDFIKPSIPQKATNPCPVPRGDASSSFHPYLTPNQVVPFKKHRHIRCSKCHHKGHHSHLCPQRRNSSSAASSCGHSPPDIRTPSSFETNITAPNTPPQTMCSLCGQLAHHGNKCGP